MEFLLKLVVTTHQICALIKQHNSDSIPESFCEGLIWWTFFSILRVSIYYLQISLHCKGNSVPFSNNNKRYQLSSALQLSEVQKKPLYVNSHIQRIWIYSNQWQKITKLVLAAHSPKVDENDNKDNYSKNMISNFLRKTKFWFLECGQKSGGTCENQ